MGNGAATTRTNQIVLGNATNTVTAPGIVSAASLAAQTGPTNFVTTDAGGNLATSALSPASIAGLDARVSGLEGRAGVLENRVSILDANIRDARREARRGVAASAGIAPVLMPSAPGKTTVQVRAAAYRGETGTGITIAHRLDANLPVVLSAGYSNGGGREHIVHVGGGFEF